MAMGIAFLHQRLKILLMLRPTISFSPLRDKILFLKRISLPSLAELARQEEKLAGVRIDGKSNSRSRMSFYTGITLGPEKEIYGFPCGAKLNFVTWVETQDGGDAKIEVSPRDIIYTEPAEPLENEKQVVLHKLDFRYRGISWCDDSLALVYESCIKQEKHEPGLFHLVLRVGIRTYFFMGRLKMFTQILVLPCCGKILPALM